MFQDACHLEEECAARIFKAQSLTCGRKGLAREARKQEVELWNVRFFDFRDVAAYFVLGVILF